MAGWHYHRKVPCLNWAFSWRTELAKVASFWMALVHHSERTKLPRFHGPIVDFLGVKVQGG